jgi:hypothetical protein
MSQGEKVHSESISNHSRFGNVDGVIARHFRHLRFRAPSHLMAGGKTKGGEVNVRGIDHLVAQSIALKSAPELPITDHVRQITG